MKLESTKSKHPQLVYEAKLYKILQGAVGALRRRARVWVLDSRGAGGHTAIACTHSTPPPPRYLTRHPIHSVVRRRGAHPVCGA